jgi:hypothetical protein
MPGLHASEKLHFDYQDVSLRQWGEFIVTTKPTTTNETTTIPTNETTTMTSAVDNETTAFCISEDTNNISIPHDNVIHQCEKPDHSTSNGDGNHHQMDQEEQPQQQLQLPISSTHAMTDLFSRQDQWIAHHPDIVPHPKAQIRILPRNVAHYIEVVLEIPESERNRNLGMFIVGVQLQSSNRTLLASSMRTVRMPHESNWISVVRKIICIVPLMLGALQENRQVLVPSFRFFVESDRLPLVGAVLTTTFAPGTYNPLPNKPFGNSSLTPSPSHYCSSSFLLDFFFSLLDRDMCLCH